MNAPHPEDVRLCNLDAQERRLWMRRLVWDQRFAAVYLQHFDGGETHVSDDGLLEIYQSGMTHHLAVHHGKTAIAFDEDSSAWLAALVETGEVGEAPTRAQALRAICVLLEQRTLAEQGKQPDEIPLRPLFDHEPGFKDEGGGTLFATEKPATEATPCKA